MSTKPDILITRTDLERCGFGRERVRSALARITPAKVERRARYYDLTTAISAALAEGETAREREARLRGDVIEEKLRRMRGEVIPLADASGVWKEKIVRIVHAIRGTELPQNEISKLCRLLRHEIEQAPAELGELTFPEFDDDTNDAKEEDHEND